MDKELFWFEHAKEAWIPASFAHQDGVLVATTLSGEEVETTEASTKGLTAVHPSALQGVDNMIELEDLNEGVILHTLRDRYAKDQIYTLISSILVSVNPYQVLPIYGKENMRLIRFKNQPHLGQRKQKGLIEPNAPHVYNLAADVHRALVNTGSSQAVIISGESGAGKTEATKLILQYLSYLSKAELPPMPASMRHRGMKIPDMLKEDPNQEPGVEERLLQANPIIEAFGNAKTVRNDNSSRFGKWIEIQLDSQHCISGGEITHYLLEKSRIVYQAPGERNYHIFYHVLRAEDPLLDKYDLKDPSHYNLLMNAEDHLLPDMDDQKLFDRTKASWKGLLFSQSDQQSLCDIVVAVLRMSNIVVEAKDGDEEKSAIPEGDEDLKATAELLGVDPAKLADALTSYDKKVVRELINVPFKLAQARTHRHALTKYLYSKMFDWIISKINVSLRNDRYVFGVIGVLDIFGFEIFETNRFEQFLINFANEKLQKHFNHFVFELEQDEYKAEGLKVAYVDFKDNTACLKLIEYKTGGILSMLDEEVKLPKGSDDNFLERAHKKHAGHPHYKKPRTRVPEFGVVHYAGEVTYEVTGFLEKNKDKLDEGALGFLKESTNDWVKLVMLPAAEEGEAPEAPRGGRKALRTLGGQFKKQLASLYSKLESTSPSFIRCIKPNSLKRPSDFDAPLILRQLKYAGIQAVIEVRKQGFPYRLLHKNFYRRFRLLVPSLRVVSDADLPVEGINDEVAEGEDSVFGKLCVELLLALEVQPEEYGIGYTKVFLVHERYLLIEAQREETIKDIVIRLQAARRGKLARDRATLRREALENLKSLCQCSEDMPLQDQLGQDFGEALQDALQEATTAELPAWFPQQHTLAALITRLATLEEGRQQLQKAAETETEDVALFTEALEAAQAISDELCTLAEWRACAQAKETLIAMLAERKEREEREAREKAEREERIAREKALEEERKLKEAEDKRLAEAEAERLALEASSAEATDHDADADADADAAKTDAPKGSRKKGSRKRSSRKGRRASRKKERKVDTQEAPKDAMSALLRFFEKEKVFPMLVELVQSDQRFSHLIKAQNMVEAGCQAGSSRLNDSTSNEGGFAPREGGFSPRSRKPLRTNSGSAALDSPSSTRRSSFRSPPMSPTSPKTLRGKEKLEEAKLEKRASKVVEEGGVMSNIVRKLQRQVQSLENEKADMSSLYRELHNNLFAKLTEAEVYKKKVSNMEGEYLKRIDTLQGQIEYLQDSQHSVQRTLEQIRVENEKSDSVRKAKEDEKRKRYEEKITKLEEQNNQNMKDLIFKCNAVLEAKIEFDAQSTQLFRVQKENKKLKELVSNIQAQASQVADQSSSAAAQVLAQREDYISKMEQQMQSVMRENKLLKKERTAYLASR